MGSERLSKIARRDIRRAFSPEASAEVFRFVEHTEKALEDRCVGIERSLTQALATSEATLWSAYETHQQVHDALRTWTFRQRLNWLLRGIWP